MPRITLPLRDHHLRARRQNPSSEVGQQEALKFDHGHNRGQNLQDTGHNFRLGDELAISRVSNSTRYKGSKTDNRKALSIGREFAIFLFFAAFLLSTTFSLMAQTSLGASSLAGTVRDPSSAAIPGAEVTLTDVQRGSTRTATTNAQGEYQFNAIQPGLYSLHVARKGFSPATVQNVKIVIDQAATVNVKLQIGTVSQQVIVNAAGSTPLLDTTSNAMGTVMGSRHVADLPLNGRNFLQLGSLVGGSQKPTGGSDIVTAQTGHSDLSISVTGANQF
ncbi:MAG: carboxypeptidase-like regulatory domain-containing protein [Acidobacteriaceae bacterium]